MQHKNFFEFYYPRIILFLLQVCLPFFILYSFKYNLIYWVYSLLIFLFLLLMGSSIAQHCYFTHKQFKAPKWFETILLFIPLYYFQTIFKFSIVHQIHHDYSDTELDPIGAWNPWYRRLFVGLDKMPSTKLMYEYGSKLKNKKMYIKTRWIEKNYNWLVLFFPILFLSIGIDIFLFLWAIPASLILWSQGTVALFSHHRDKPINRYNFFVNLFWGLEAKTHEQHHNKPGVAFSPLAIFFSKVFS